MKPNDEPSVSGLSGSGFDSRNENDEGASSAPSESPENVQQHDI